MKGPNKQLISKKTILKLGLKFNLCFLNLKFYIKKVFTKFLPEAVVIELRVEH